MSGLEIFAICVVSLVVLGAIMALFQHQGRWLLFQGFIVFLVVASNIHWQWTPNRAIPFYFGAALALGATIVIARIRFGNWLWPAG